MYSSFQGLFFEITSQGSNSGSQILRSAGRKGVAPPYPTALYSVATAQDSNSYMVKVEDRSLGALDVVSYMAGGQGKHDDIFLIQLIFYMEKHLF